jgi:hypothetical protein
MLLPKLGDAITENMPKGHKKGTLPGNGSDKDENKGNRHRPHNPRDPKRQTTTLPQRYTAIISCPKRGGKETIMRKMMGTIHEP